MSSTNTKLAITALILLTLSVVSYRQSVSRTERFERGQRFLAQLDPDEIARIEITKGGETTILRRAEDQFLVENLHNHPARNENVNRFLREILEIELEKEVGDSEDLRSELGLEPGGEETTEVVLQDAAGKTMVSLLLGNSLPQSGTYMRRADGENQTAYLSQKQLFLTTDAKGFLDKEIVHAERGKVRKIQGSDYLIEKVEGNWTMANLPAGKELDSTKTSRLEGLADRLTFEEVHLASDPELQGLSFDESLTIDLDDDSGYRLVLATSDDENYLRISGFHHVQQLEITREESEEELADKADVLKRADEVHRFTQDRASWIYQVRSGVAESVGFRRADLLKDPS